MRHSNNSNLSLFINAISSILSQVADIQETEIKDITDRVEVIKNEKIDYGKTSEYILLPALSKTTDDNDK